MAEHDGVDADLTGVGELESSPHTHPSQILSIPLKRPVRQLAAPAGGAGRTSNNLIALTEKPTSNRRPPGRDQQDTRALHEFELRQATPYPI